MYPVTSKGHGKTMNSKCWDRSNAETIGRWRLITQGEPISKAPMPKLPTSKENSDKNHMPHRKISTHKEDSKQDISPSFSGHKSIHHTHISFPNLEQKAQNSIKTSLIHQSVASCPKQGLCYCFWNKKRDLLSSSLPCVLIA